MRIPPPTPRIDVDDARAAIERGETVASWARRERHTVHAVYAALRRAGIARPRRKSQIRDVSDERLHGLWTSIRARCLNPASPMYRLYGARGIHICAAWESFSAFRDWARANGYSSGKALVLRVRSRGYAPGNCEWAERADAIRRGMLAGDGAKWGISAFGEIKTATSWAKDPRAKVCGETIRQRLFAGLDPEQAITLAPGSPVLGNPKRPRQGRSWHEIDWERVRTLYVERGLGVPETAARLGVSYHGILRGLQKRGWVRERAKPAHAMRHGRALHKAWQAMRERCNSPKHPEYGHVGARGIRIDPTWAEFAGFHAWALSAGYRKGLCLTRLDRRANFGPENCAWLPRREASQYHRPTKVTRTPRWTVTAFGESKGPLAWSRDPRCTVTMSGLLARLRSGMSPEDAISRPNRRADVELDGRSVTAFGSAKSIAAWARDRRARVGAGAIGRRLDRGMAPEAAITTTPFQQGHRAAGRMRV